MNSNLVNEQLVKIDIKIIIFVLKQKIYMQNKISTSLINKSFLSVVMAKIIVSCF